MRRNFVILTFFSRYKKVWRRDKLMIFIIIAVIFGFLVGLTTNEPIQQLQEPTKSTVLILMGFPGESIS